MIGLLRSNLGIFLLRKFGVAWIYIDLPGVVIWQHIHPFMLHSYWEEGWQDSSCRFLGLRIIEWRNSSDILEWGPGAKQTGNITLIALNVSPDWITPEVHIAGNLRLSLLVHLSSLHYHSLGSIHLKLLSCWVERMPLCPPKSVRWS